MKCGLADGMLYDAVLVGLDKVGDVALIKLLPKKRGDKFPFAELGDSDKVKAGDWSLAMGNPFLLATDFTPTVTFGLVSGVHRYQYPAGTLLEYTDCIQIDTSINPGNSGGPLFNMDGELIGINGRGSFEKRGRVNSGVGYAISINQIKNFLGQLRAGIDTDHATLGAVAWKANRTRAASSKTASSTAIIDMRRPPPRPGPGRRADVLRRPADDHGQPVQERPRASIPRAGACRCVYRRENRRKREILVRLMGVQRQELHRAQPRGSPAPSPASSPAAKPPAQRRRPPSSTRPRPASPITTSTSWNATACWPRSTSTAISAPLTRRLDDQGRRQLSSRASGATATHRHPGEGRQRRQDRRDRRRHRRHRLQPRAARPDDQTDRRSSTRPTAAAS